MGRKTTFLLMAGIFLPVLLLAQSLPTDKANRAFISHDYATALKLYQSVAESPMGMMDAPFAFFQIAECYRLLGNQELAGRAYWRLITDYPESEWADNAYLELASRSTVQGRENLTEAVVLYETILSTYGDSDSVPYAWLGLAETRRRLNLFEGAENALNKLINAFPKHAINQDAHYEMSRLLSDPVNPRRNIDLAIQHGKTLITQYPQSPHIPSTLYTLGNLYWEKKDYEHAIQSFREIVQSHSDTFFAPSAQTNIGLCYTDLKAYDKAIEAYENLLAKFPQPQSVRDNILNLIDKLQNRDSERLQVSAWVAQVDKNTRIANYEGDVRISIGKTVITADMAQVDPNRNMVSAWDNVRLNWGKDLIIISDRIECDVKVKTAIATGNVLLQRRIGKNMHQEAWNYLELSLIDGSSQGRTQSTKQGTE
ncbi:tetratricopeptide repeat protein [bacterium]|nr:tetratricopeptide repeat protein [candidate division CSSED10-310 bacterium]